MNLTIDGVSLQAVGPSLTLRLAAGRSMSIFGPSGSGKSKLVRVLAGLDRPARGTAKLGCPAAIAGLPHSAKRATPLEIAKRATQAGGAAQVAEALTAAHLWSVRKESIADLDPAQTAACELLPVLAASERLLLIDGQLERLDPWTLAAVLDALGAKLKAGASLVAATEMPSMAPRTDMMVVLQGGRIVFSGTYSQLEAKFPASRLTVETHHQPGVRALVAPFEVAMEQAEGTISLRAKEGQKIAAKLLTEGYGDVKAVVLRKPEPDELLRQLLLG